MLDRRHAGHITWLGFLTTRCLIPPVYGSGRYFYYRTCYAPSSLTCIGLALFVGVTFGFFPALYAARLSPIDALRTSE